MNLEVHAEMVHGAIKLITAQLGEAKNKRKWTNEHVVTAASVNFCVLKFFSLNDRKRERKRDDKLNADWVNICCSLKFFWILKLFAFVLEKFQS